MIPYFPIEGATPISPTLNGKIVGMVQFDGRLIIAAESGLFELIGEELRAIPLKVVE